MRLALSIAGALALACFGCTANDQPRPGSGTGSLSAGTVLEPVSAESEPLGHEKWSIVRVTLRPPGPP